VKDDRVYLLHIRDAVERIMDYTGNGEKMFFEDTKTQDAVVRNLEVIGEAVKSLSADLRSAAPAVPWKQMAGMRDKMIHEYFGVDLKIVWAVVENELPRLKNAIHDLLEKNKGVIE